jgi:hypothetical protein
MEVMESEATSGSEYGRAQQAGEKGLFLSWFSGEQPAGAKAQLILLALSARLKSCPVTKPARHEFFRSL